jgi:hypothetical protein
MTPLVKYSFRFVLLLLLQYLLLLQAPLGQYITPYIYFVYILWLPFNIKRGWLMILAAVYGLALGYLVAAPGLHAAACVLIAYIRPFLINLLLPREAAEMNFAEPSVHSMGLAPYTVYVLTLTLMHHAWLVLLQWMTVGGLWFFLKKVIATSAVSLLLLAVAEIVVVRKGKTRASLNN